MVNPKIDLGKTGEKANEKTLFAPRTGLAVGDARRRTLTAAVRRWQPLDWSQADEKHTENSIKCYQN